MIGPAKSLSAIPIAMTISRDHCLALRITMENSISALFQAHGLAQNTKWFFRRVLGKPTGGLRVLNSAMTFDGGLDYVQHKLENHSGVRIDVTESQRRHPILWSPVLAWKYWRKGAFR